MTSSQRTFLADQIDHEATDPTGLSSKYEDFLHCSILIRRHVGDYCFIKSSIDSEGVDYSNTYGSNSASAVSQSVNVRAVPKIDRKRSVFVELNDYTVNERRENENT